MLRVVDSSKVPSAAGKNGIIKNLRKNNKVIAQINGIILRPNTSDESCLAVFWPRLYFSPRFPWFSCHSGSLFFSLSPCRHLACLLLCFN